MGECHEITKITKKIFLWFSNDFLGFIFASFQFYHKANWKVPMVSTIPNLGKCQYILIIKTFCKIHITIMQVHQAPYAHPHEHFANPHDYSTNSHQNHYILWNVPSINHCAYSKMWTHLTKLEIGAHLIKLTTMPYSQQQCFSLKVVTPFTWQKAIHESHKYGSLSKKCQLKN